MKFTPSCLIANPFDFNRMNLGRLPVKLVINNDIPISCEHLCSKDCYV